MPPVLVSTSSVRLPILPCLTKKIPRTRLRGWMREALRCAIVVFGHALLPGVRPARRAAADAAAGAGPPRHAPDARRRPRRRRPFLRPAHHPRQRPDQRRHVLGPAVLS